MNESTAMLMCLLNDCFYAAAIVAIVDLPFLIVNFLKCRGNNLSSRNYGKIIVWPVKSVCFFAIPIMLAIACADTAQSVGRSQALKVLGSASESTTVLVNGKMSGGQKEIIQALSGINSAWAHHSHPTKRIIVEIRNGTNNFVLQLGRDSDRPQEYWVFLPLYSITDKNEIGRITTSLFDKY